ncbi:MAG: hypothetical protein LLG16_08050 [Euryarchaeota archaeon]|nr:hypothetical protein [Euryarchaeota archaeon]
MIGHETKAVRLVFALLLAMSAFPIIAFFFLPDEERWAMVLVAGIMFFTVFVFGLSPLLTKHEIHDTHVVLRQGWYYRNRIDLTDIMSIKRVREGPWSYGLHFIGGGIVYVNGSTKDLLLIESSERISRNGKKRKMNRILFETLDDDKFVKMIGREFDGHISRS